MNTTSTILMSALLLGTVACESTPTPTADSSSKPATTTVASAKPTASALPVASTVAPAPTASEMASAAPSASAPAVELIPSEKASDAAPTAEEFDAQDKEIAVRASGEQQCSTKILKGWFEMKCGVAPDLVRPTKFEILSGFVASTTSAEPGEGATFRFVAALPASGEMSQVRFYGAKLHEIFLTLRNTATGWKGELTGKKPS